MSRLFTDQLSCPVEINQKPKKIVSLVPSLTELLFDLGAGEQLVGVTRYCVHPQQVRQQKTLIGRPKTFDFSVIDELKPDLILGNKEENYKEGIETLSQKYPVVMQHINTSGCHLHDSICRRTDRPRK